MAKRRRPVIHTILIYWEGEVEFEFLHYLKGTFYVRKSGKTVDIKNAFGGSPEEVVKKAREIPAQYDEKYVLIDSDRPEIERARKLAKSAWISVIENNPCVEELFLSLHWKDTASLDSSECKEKCHSTILDEKSLLDRGEYWVKFPKDFLESKKGSFPQIDCLIRIFSPREES